MSLNKIKQQDATSEQQKKTDSKINYEDCFVYGESRFNGKKIIIDFISFRLKYY